MFFCHTPKKWGYGTPTEPLQKVGVRVTPVNYGYGGKGKVKHLLASKYHSGHRGLFLAIRCDAMARASGSGMRNMGEGRCSVGQVGHGTPKILVGWATMHLAPPIIGLYVR